MNSDPRSIEWKNLSQSSRKRRWSQLSEFGRALAWKHSDRDDRQAIADITNIDLNTLQHRAEQISDPLEDELLETQGESVDSDVNFKLQRIHREIVETELEGIRSAFLKYSTSNERRSRKRRAENIYILVALGIIGGFLTLNPNLNFVTVFDFIGLAFALAAGAFTLIKIITVRFTHIGQDTRLSWVDNILDTGFATVITGVFVFGSAALLISFFSLEITTSTQGLTIISIIFAMLVQIWYAYGRLEEESSKDPEALHDNIIENLFLLPESNNPDKLTQDIVSQLEELSEASVITRPIEDIRSKVGKINNIPDSCRNRIEDKSDELIEKMELEDKTDEELREEKLSNLLDEKDEYLSKVED